jgi:HAE1 family hydrophobic/amphiphilic exporter-1
MSISEPFIRRPVMTTLVTLMIVVLGLAGYRALPVSDLPNVDFPTIQIGAGLPGASPETIAAAIATPIERQLSTIAGITSMTSTSTLGGTQITLQFELSRSIDAASIDVAAALQRAGPQLPQNMPSPPTFTKVNPADAPVLYVAVSSATLPLSDVDEYAETTIAQRVSMLPGVAQVQVFGSQKYAVRVELDPSALASRRIGLDEVAAAVQSANVELPTGVLWGADRAFTVRASGQLMRAAAYRPIIVAYRNGAPVRLEAVGRVLDAVENDKVASWLDTTRAVVLAIQRQPGTNTVEVVDAVRALLPTFRGEVPASIAIDVLYDRSASIRDSVKDVELTLGLTIGLVVLVIYLFLHNASATLISAVALPVSLVGTFAVLALLGDSLDNLSLMALTLSVGFVVDDAIVVLENIVRHAEHGAGARDAAVAGTREIGFTVLSMTLSLVAVFIPVLFMAGILGRLLHEFALTIGVAILLSGFVSLTLTPMLASRFLRPPGEGRSARSGRAFARLERRYEASLAVVLRHRGATLVAAALLLAGTVWLAIVAPKGLFPSQDTSQIFAQTEADEGTSFDAMVRYQQQAAAVIRADPNVESLMSSVGASTAGTTSNTGRIFARLKPTSERALGVDQIIDELRPKLARLPGLRVYLQNPPVIRIGGQLTKAHSGGRR